MLIRPHKSLSDEIAGITCDAGNRPRCRDFIVGSGELMRPAPVPGQNDVTKIIPYPCVSYTKDIVERQTFPSGFTFNCNEHFRMKG